MSGWDIRYPHQFPDCKPVGRRRRRRLFGNTLKVD